MIKWYSLAVLSLALAGCGDGGSGTGKDGDNGGDNGGSDEPVDTDGDGLMDDEEAALGSDPTLPDTDGDGLLDNEEVDAGTDPTAADSDGDTYTDFDELTEGTDPNDPESRIYIGYWPYNRDKDSLVDPGWDGSNREGSTVPRFIGPDQYGDEVDLYDFANQGKPVILNLTAEW